MPKEVGLLRILRYSLLAFVPLLAQSPAEPAFEVASVKRVQLATNRINYRLEPGRVTYLAHNICMLVMKAYSVREFQVSGSPCTQRELYDVVATMPPTTPREQVPLMLRSLLKERFKLVLHSTRKETPVWGLVVTAQGLQLKPSDVTNQVHGPVSPEQARIFGSGTLDEVARIFSYRDHIVFNMTGVSSAFEYDLKWKPYMNVTPAPASPPAEDAPDLSGSGPVFCPALFKELARVGLKLEPRKVPVEYLVVDSAGRPAENE